MAELGGHVTFEVGSTAFALDVGEVAGVVRTTEVDLLPASDRTLAGRPLALADTGGRAVPVLDLRSDPGRDGDVLLPRLPDHAGAVVDRVTAVLRPGELQVETLVTPALPSYAIGVLRPAGGGTPVLLVTLPAIPELGSAEYDQRGEPALGESVAALASVAGT
jgi:chemotaxis signal transduction protein